MTDDRNEQASKPVPEANRRTDSRTQRPGRGKRNHRRRSRSPKRSERTDSSPESHGARSGRQNGGKQRNTVSSRGKRSSAGATRGHSRKNPTKRTRNKKLMQEVALQAEAMQPDPDYVPPDSVFLYTHVRRQSYRDFDRESLQRPRWFTRIESDSNYQGQ